MISGIDRFDKDKILREMLCNFCQECGLLIYAVDPPTGLAFCPDCARNWTIKRKGKGKSIFYEVMRVSEDPQFAYTLAGWFANQWCSYEGWQRRLKTRGHGCLTRNPHRIAHIRWGQR